MGGLAILAGGGPAPGINAVISAATIRARIQGIEVHGVLDGFSRLIDGAEDATMPLEIDDVARTAISRDVQVGYCPLAAVHKLPAQVRPVDRRSAIARAEARSVSAEFECDVVVGMNG